LTANTTDRKAHLLSPFTSTKCQGTKWSGS